jgi:hypothetical protein
MAIAQSFVIDSGLFTTSGLQNGIVGKLERFVARRDWHLTKIENHS